MNQSSQRVSDTADATHPCCLIFAVLCFFALSCFFFFSFWTAALSGQTTALANFDLGGTVLDASRKRWGLRVGPFVQIFTWRRRRDGILLERFVC